ncbi:MAG: FtsW/RodA/SpoVE family cell cycle protein [Coriobacteriia bacterium]|nr:FtsW/RodA/SpoVE family cell cycle protein [Coriobacteriia bacterium]
MGKERNTQSKRTTSSLPSTISKLGSGTSSGQFVVGAAALCLMVVGVVMVYSASSIELVSGGQAPYAEALKQVIFIVAGLVVVAGLAVVLKFRIIPASYLLWGFYAFCLALLLLTGLMGTSQYGAARWFSIGGFTIQGSEFAKIAFVLVTAYFVEKHHEGRITKVRFSICIAGFVFLPLAILFATQSDLGTTMICFVGVYSLVWVGKVYTTRTMLAILVAVGLVGVFAILAFPYRMARFAIFWDPWSDPDDQGYQYVHSFKALAAGGLFGVGLGGSYQKMLYLPMASTDFIFAIVGEELGLVGAVFVIFLFVALLFGGLKIASDASSNFAFVAVTGLSVMIVFQAFLNIFCVIGCAPITGKPLPFISSGGSSMVSSVLTVGLILLIGSGLGSPDVYEQRRRGLSVVSSDAAGSRRPRASTAGSAFSRFLPQASSSRSSYAGRTSSSAHRGASDGARRTRDAKDDPYRTRGGNAGARGRSRSSASGRDAGRRDSGSAAGSRSRYDRQSERNSRRYR